MGETEWAEIDSSTLLAFQKQYHTQKRLADSLFGLFRTLGSELHVERVANIGLLTLTGQLLIKCAAFFSRDEDGSFHLLATVGARDTGFGELHLPESSPLLVRLFSEGGVQGIPADPNTCHPTIGELRTHGFRSLFPLADGADALGIIALGEKIAPGPLTTEDLQIIDAFGVVISTSLKNSLAYRLVETSRNELARLNEMKREFLSHVSHEFRTPLTILKSTIEMSKVDSGIHEMQVSALARFEYLINSVLLLNEINSQGVVLDRQRVNSLTWIEQSIRPLVERLGSFDLHVDLPDCTLEFDPFKIRTALESLVDNATKFGTERKRGEVRVFFSSQPQVLRGMQEPVTEAGDLELQILDPPEPLDPKSEDTVIVFEVKDSGIGIPSNEVDAIFQPFTQAINSPTRGVKGAGLGLAMCKAIVDAHGGQVFCRSAVNRGTVFYIIIPVGCGSQIGSV